MNETSGELQPAIANYLNERELTVRQVSLLRTYLRQWIDSPAWDMNPHADDAGRAELQSLREGAQQIVTVRDIRVWIDKATSAGMDPL